MTNPEIKLTPLYFIRHAPVANSKQGLYFNHDEEVTLPSPQAIEEMANELPENAKWYISPLIRTYQTASALINMMGETDNFEIRDEITEQDFGDWQGHSFDQLWAKIENYSPHNWSLLSADTCPPNGESFAEVCKRVSNFMDELSTSEPERPKIIITHAGVIRAAIGYVLDISPDKALSFEFKPFSLSQILHQTGTGNGGIWQINYLNKIFD